MFLISALDVGGAERQLVMLAKGLQQRGHNVTVVTFYDRGTLRDDLAEDAVPVVSLHKSGRWDIARFTWHLLRTVHRARPDVLHSYLTMPNLLAAALRPIMRPRHLVWGIRYANMDLAAYDWLSRLSYRLQRHFASRADLVIANSHAGQEMAIREGYPNNRVVHIANGIDVERFAPKHGNASSLRPQWTNNGDGPLIGIVARLDPMKDHETFLNAAALIAKKNPAVRFVCIGGGQDSLRTRLQAIAGELGIADRVVWADIVSDMPAAYQDLDLCVLSSAFGEGFPNVVAEAMACGVRCVVTDVGDAAAIVGETGLVVPPHQPEAMAAAIIKMLDNANTAILPDPRARILSNYTVGAMVARTEAALETLLQ